MDSEERKFNNREDHSQSIEEQEALLGLFTERADERTKAYLERKKAQELEKIELLSGATTSRYQEKLKREILAQTPQNHEPKFREFFSSFGKLMGWTEEEMKSFHKPHIVATTINEIIYDRFTKEVRQHIQEKNPYIRYCTRKYLKYMFLGEDGILLLEEYIYDAVSIIKKSKSYYELRTIHAEEFGTTFQLDLFK
jgi:hypothetical protein